MCYLKVRHLVLVVLSALMLTACSNLDIQTLNQNAKELMDKGDIDGAIGRLQSINDLNPKYPQTHFNLGVAYYKKGDYEKAVNSLNKAVELDNKFADAYYTLAVIYESTAITEADKDKKENTLNKPEVLNNLIAYWQSAKDNYNQYLSTAQSPTDVAEIKTRIEGIDQEISKYQKMLAKAGVN